MPIVDPIFADDAVPPPDRPRPPLLSIQSLSSPFAGFVNRREFWALLDQAVVSATNFLTNIVLARLAGIEVFGTFALAWMVVLFASLFQDAFVISPMLSVQPKLQDSERADYLGAILIHGFLVASLFTIAIQGVCFCIGHFCNKHEFELVAPALAVATGFYLAQNLLRRYLFTIRRSSAAFSSDLLSYPPQVILIVIVAKMHGISAEGGLWIVALTSAVGAVAATFCLDSIRFSLAASRRIAVRHWRLSRWLALSVVSSWMSANLFFVVAPVFFGSAAAGIVRASQNILGVTNIWFIGLGNVIPAETARALHARGLGAAQRYVRSVIFRWGGITLLFCSVVCVFPVTVLHLAYGARFDNYGYLLRLYALLYLLMFLGYPLMAMLQALEFTAPIFWAYVVIGVFASIFSVPLVHAFGLSGVALGSIATQLIFNSILYASIRVRSPHYSHPEPI